MPDYTNISYTERELLCLTLSVLFCLYISFSNIEHADVCLNRGDCQSIEDILDKRLALFTEQMNLIRLALNSLKSYN